MISDYAMLYINVKNWMSVGKSISFFQKSDTNLSNSKIVHFLLNQSLRSAKKYLSLVSGADRKICFFWSLFGITWHFIWWQSVTRQYEKMLICSGISVVIFRVVMSDDPKYHNWNAWTTVELQWLEHRWLVYHGCFELAFECLGKNPIAADLG